jgi:deoxycytidine triphosphate deaminase
LSWQANGSPPSIATVYWGGERIRRALASGEIAFTGDLRGDGLLLTAGGPLQPLKEGTDPVDLRIQREIDALYEDLIHEWREYTLRPKQVVLIQASEHLQLRSNALGEIGTLSHLARCGVMAHLASPFVAPNFSGYLTMEVFNAGGRPLVLTQGMPVAKVMLCDIDGHEPAGRQPLYGEESALSSKYGVEFGRGKAGPGNV